MSVGNISQKWSSEILTRQENAVYNVSVLLQDETMRVRTPLLPQSPRATGMWQVRLTLVT